MFTIPFYVFLYNNFITNWKVNNLGYNELIRFVICPIHNQWDLNLVQEPVKYLKVS